MNTIAQTPQIVIASDARAKPERISMQWQGGSIVIQSRLLTIITSEPSNYLPSQKIELEATMSASSQYLALHRQLAMAQYLQTIKTGLKRPIWSRYIRSFNPIITYFIRPNAIYVIKGARQSINILSYLIRLIY